MARRIHGVMTPKNKTPVPARVINVQSRRKPQEQSKIRLDKLLKSPRPVICIKRRLGGIGDVIMTTPLLKAIKRLIPHCHLIYATDLKYSQGALAEIIQHNKYVDELVSFSNVNDENYDYSVDITTTGLDKEKSGSIPPNRIDMFADAVGVSVDEDPVPIYEVTEEERTCAREDIVVKYLQGRKREEVKIIALQARSNDARRTWPLKYVEKLSKLLTEDKDIIVLLFDWGHTASNWKEDERVFPVVDLKLSKTAALVEQVDLVICPDSSMLHLAGALNKKILTIFGPIPPESRINHYQNASAATLNLACMPCWYSPRCTRSSESSKLECLTKLSPETVLSAATKKLAEEDKAKPMIKYGKDISSSGQDSIILVRRSTAGIGDILMASTGIEALKEKFPTKDIHLACHQNVMEAVKNNPYIDEVINADSCINYKRYFMIIDISYPCARYESTRIRMGKEVEKSRVEIFSEAMGVRNLIKDLRPRYYITEEEKEEAKQFFKIVSKNKKKKKIALALKSAEEYRDWPEYKFGELIKELKNDFELVTLHHTKDFFFEDVIDACGLSFRKASAILSQCDGLITIDSGLLHVAAALNVPIIAIFGPIDFKSRCKGYNNILAIKSDLDCIPCWRNGFTKCEKTGKIKGTSKCMEVISANKITKIVKERFS